MVVSRGVEGFSRGRERMAVVSHAVVTVVSRGHESRVVNRSHHLHVRHPR